MKKSESAGAHSFLILSLPPHLLLFFLYHLSMSLLLLCLVLRWVIFLKQARGHVSMLDSWSIVRDSREQVPFPSVEFLKKYIKKKCRADALNNDVWVKSANICLALTMCQTQCTLHHFTHFLYQPCHCCSVAKLCLALYNPMNCSVPGFPVFHYLPEFAQAHVHCQ